MIIGKAISPFALRKKINGVVPTDPDAQLFITATGISGTNATATNKLVIDLKAANIWTKMKAIYPMVGGTSTTCKFNLKNPVDSNAAYRLAFYGGGTFSANGYQPGGVNGYADTFITPSTTLSLNNSHLSLYNRTNATSYFNATKIDPSIATEISMAVTTNTTEYGGRFMDDTYNSVLTPNALGFLMGNRTLSTQKKYYKNGALGGTFNVNSVALPDNILRIGVIAGNGYIVYSSGQCAFASIGDGLTDLESQLFYQITEKYQVALSRNVNTTQSFYYNSAYNNETNAFLFSTQITDNTIQTATNTLVSDLKTAGVFTKMKALYPMVGGTATAHKFNLVNPQDTDAAYRLNFVGGWTPSATGMTPNGVNAYADTFLIPSSGLILNSTHFSFYSRTNANPGGIFFGSVNVPQGVALQASVYGTNNGSIFDCYNSAVGQGRLLGTSVADSRGFAVFTRTASNSSKIFWNNALNGSITTSGGALPNTYKISISARNTDGVIGVYDNRECAFASIGDGLTDADATALYNAVQLFNTTLDRQV